MHEKYTEIFKIFWGGHTPYPPRYFALNILCIWTPFNETQLRACIIIFVCTLDIFQIYFTFFTWYSLRTFSGMFCVTDITFYVLQKLTNYLAKQNHDLLQSTILRVHVFMTRAPNYNLQYTQSHLQKSKHFQVLFAPWMQLKVKSLKTGKT